MDDDFLDFGEYFDMCLEKLDRVLARCDETNIVLNWEMKEGIVLVHNVSKREPEVDRAKVEVIEKLPPPIFGKRKEMKFVFDDKCIQDFEALKKKLIEAPILTFPNWDLHLELICIASDVVVGAVLVQRKEKVFHFIYYASKKLDGYPNQLHND
ncbi:uncharacterized protein LOC107027581 [Solanum pennellii]|uniref:Uncharacterized protein LOC107027581 n=1 Tax=Solanum pennellii TaxID=28526 RepID=A0ABM1HE52_SOLPN|nr:uncharacterized protein LOC107027581 [Solanum pennellii]